VAVVWVTAAWATVAWAIVVLATIDQVARVWRSIGSESTAGLAGMPRALQC